MTVHVDLFTSFVFSFEIWLEDFRSILVRNTYSLVSNNKFYSKIICRISNIKFRNKHINYITILRKFDWVLDQID